MTKDVIPKAENTDEIVEENLLKHTFIAKRQVLRRNQVPMKFRNNLTSAIKQTEKERSELVKNLNVTLQPSKLKEEDLDQKEILELYNQERLAYAKLKQLRKYYIDLNQEVGRWQKKESKKQNQVNHFEMRMDKEQKTYGDMEKALYRKINTYNDGVKKQKELRELYEGLRRETSQKRDIYDSLIFQLNKEAKITVNVAEEAIKSCQERENTITALEILKESNETERRQREEKMFMTKYKLRNDLDQNECLEIKHAFRHNRHKNNMKTEQENLKKENRRRNALAFIKYLIRIEGDVNLKTITDNIEKMKLDKKSLFRLLIFFEQQFSELERTMGLDKEMVADKTQSNVNSYELYECQIKKYLEKIQTNEQVIKEKKTFINSLQNLYDEVNERIYGIFQALRCDPSAVEQFGVVEMPNEYNIIDYAKEMEKKSVELLYKVNCIENSCLTGQNEDPLTSDAESKENLITKDYNCIEIKMHRFLDMADNATLPVPVNKLDLGYTPSPCPHCVETRFLEDGPCNLLSPSEMNMIKPSSKVRKSNTCCPEVLKRLDFKNINPKVAVLLHDKNNCRKTQ
ncbi:Hypothetical protein CINCED_3A019499 [Cinara cedri]|uniref:ODAD1 central coiled coil region domain-containing protein n=1 Tax=Cinara cedri TaxID=506608 RepID=A0A5E4NRC6_9HEMI|nr:Hypothetical protein CINCED_3A019499 [Cinara cedri]